MKKKHVGDNHHEEREESEDLGEFAGPWIFNCAPQPRPPLKMCNKVRKEGYRALRGKW